MNQHSGGVGFIDFTPQDLEISDRALGIAFALAGAFASTIVAFAALSAQRTATQAQTDMAVHEKNLAKDAQEQRYIDATKRDLVLHANVVSSINGVLEISQTVLEELIEHQFANIIRRSDDKIDFDELNEIGLADLEKLVTKYSPAIELSHKRLWDAVSAASLTENQELSLDTLWSKLYRTGGEDTSRFQTVLDASGLLNARRSKGSQEESFKVSQLKPRIIYLNATRIDRCIRFFSLGAIEIAVREAERDIEKRIQVFDSEKIEKLRGKRIDFRNAISPISNEIESSSLLFQELEELASKIEECVSNVRDHQMSMGGDYNYMIEVFEGDGEERSDIQELKDEFLLLSREINQKMSLMREKFSFQNEDEFSVLEAYHISTYERDKVIKEAEKIYNEAADSFDQSIKRTRSNLLVGRHMSKTLDQPKWELFQIIIGSIVMPDTAFITIKDLNENIWATNVGLALVLDIVKIYSSSSADTNIHDLRDLMNCNNAATSTSLATSGSTEVNGQLLSARPGVPFYASFDAILWEFYRNNSVKLDFWCVKQGDKGTCYVTPAIRMEKPYVNDAENELIIHPIFMDQERDFPTRDLSNRHEIDI